MYIPKYICTTVLLFYCHALPRKTTSIQGLSDHRATLHIRASSIYYAHETVLPYVSNSAIFLSISFMILSVSQSA